MSGPDFLGVEDVLAIHALQIERFGGSEGLRDRGLLESAIAQPSASFGGQWVHDDVFAMAAAYLFHLVSNHCFVDGNKRVGLAAALVFLDINGQPISTGTQALYEVTMAVARGEAGKEHVAEVLRSLAG